MPVATKPTESKQFALVRRLLRSAYFRPSWYLAAVTGELGIGLESCTVDHATPLSAYVALRYLDSPAVAPSPHSVARFARAVLEDDHACGRPDPVTIRTAGTPEAIAELLRRELP